MIKGEFGVGKPDDRVYLHALDQLNVKPEETWMVGDNLEWDVRAPQRMHCRHFSRQSLLGWNMLGVKAVSIFLL
ncbi:MAG: HAD-IA family hydrolase [Anaerolineae bacterium]